MTEIIYRGAKTTLEELQGRQEQLPQRQATRLIRYRGATTEATQEVKERKTRQVHYRGATAEVEL
ncbi:MAG: hypothetical protein AAGJ31_00565 [Verrucomicrobiota bacterium]